MHYKDCASRFYHSKRRLRCGTVGCTLSGRLIVDTYCKIYVKKDCVRYNLLRKYCNTGKTVNLKCPYIEFFAPKT